MGTASASGASSPSSRAPGWNVELADDILTPMWQKLTFIGPFAAVNTVTGLKAEQLCTRDACARLVHSMMTEYAAIARAEGADLPGEAAEAVEGGVCGFAGLSSMLRDRIAGKRLEADALVGDVVRRGLAHGIATPTTDALNCLLAPMADGGADRLG